LQKTIAEKMQLHYPNANAFIYIVCYNIV